jgi:hypothetical protein
MKRLAVFGIVASLALFSFVACGKKVEGPGAGTAVTGNLLNLLPKNVQGVIVFDFNRAINMPFADKAIKEDKNQAKYQEFIKETGIDPQKDIYGIALALAGQTEGMAAKQEGVVVVSLKYNKDLLLAKMKKDGDEIKEETYEGVVIYSGVKTEPGKPPASAAFLDASTALVGTDDMVRQVIDVSRKKGENVLKNDALAAIIKTANKGALVWSAFAIPEEATKKLAQSNPMMSALEGMKAMTLFFDYKDKTYLFEIKTQGGDETKNTQLAGMLTGFKALGAGAAAKNPDIGELLNRIEITSGADFVKIGAGLPEDILERLSKSAAKKVEGMIAPPGGTPGETVPEEPEEAPSEEPED